MATHLFVCGHGSNDPGAVGNGTNERDFTRNVFKPAIDKWAKQLKNNRIEWYDVKRNMFTDTTNGWGLYNIKSNQYKTVSEWHLDAASASATGGHVIINSDFSPDNVDLSLANAIKNVVGWWGGVANTKGVNKRNNLLNCNIAALRSIDYRLVEMCFITNGNDMKTIREKMDTFARLVVESVTGEKLSVADVAPTQTKTQREPHYVLVGWFTQGKTTKLENWLKKEKMNYKLVADAERPNRIFVQVGTFTQSSNWKRKLEVYLHQENWSYIVCYNRQILDNIRKW